MAEALARARATSDKRSLKIATLPLFAATWLAKRLPAFESAYPDVTLSIHTDPRIYDVRVGEADVAIRNVDAPTSGLFARKLMDLRAVPLCSPSIAEGLTSPADLSRATLISLSVGRAGWKEWLATAGHPDVKPRRMIIVDTMLEAVAAAAQGRGIILGLAPFVYDAPGAEGLVAPFDAQPQPGGAYFIVCRSEDRTAGIVGAFVDWVIADMRKDARRLQKLGRPA
jgi:LysR family glycine cleavage system transcriptional activator